MRTTNQLLIGVGLVVACASAPVAQDAEGTLGKLITKGGFMLTREAKRQSDSAWLAGYRARTETAMCARSGSFAYGVAMNGKPFVLVSRFGPADLLGADSLNVFWRDRICGDSLPSWHSHVIDNSIRHAPSDCDRHGAAVRPRVPFHIQVGDTNSIRVYTPHPQYADTSRAWCGHAFNP